MHCLCSSVFRTQGALHLVSIYLYRRRLKQTALVEPKGLLLKKRPQQKKWLTKLPQRHKLRPQPFFCSACSPPWFFFFSFSWGYILWDGQPSEANKGLGERHFAALPHSRAMIFRAMGPVFLCGINAGILALCAHCTPLNNFTQSAPKVRRFQALQKPNAIVPKQTTKHILESSCTHFIFHKGLKNWFGGTRPLLTGFVGFSGQVDSSRARLLAGARNSPSMLVLIELMRQGWGASGRQR